MIVCMIVAIGGWGITVSLDEELALLRITTLSYWVASFEQKNSEAQPIFKLLLCQQESVFHWLAWSLKQDNLLTTTITSVSNND
jgi:hypothetical protein